MLYSFFFLLINYFQVKFSIEVTCELLCGANKERKKSFKIYQHFFRSKNKDFFLTFAQIKVRRVPF